MTNRPQEILMFISLKLMETYYNICSFLGKKWVKITLNTVVFMMLATLWGLVIHLIINELLPALGVSSFSEFFSGFYDLLKREGFRSVVGLSGMLLVTFLTPVVAICSAIFFCLKKDLRSSIGWMFWTFAVGLTYVAAVLLPLVIALTVGLLLLSFYSIYNFLQGSEG